MKKRKLSVPPRTGSFTLIELLIVITIVSILAALLTPALSKAKARANDIKCASNMRQIHMAIMLYANDRQHYPALTMLSPGNYAQYEQITLFSNTITKFDFYRCPSSQGTNNLPSLFFTTLAGTPVWTEYKMNDDDYQFGNRPIDYQLRPARVVAVIDAAEGWAPRHGADKNKSNVCFVDGHIEMMTMSVYNGPEPGSTTGLPIGWYRWGLYDL